MAIQALRFVAFDGDDPNGSPVGELTESAGKFIDVEYNGTGGGELAVSRHSSQAHWSDPGAYIRAYLDDTGGDPVFAWWVTQSNDEILGADEDGIEVYRRQGNGALYYLSDAIVWYRSVTNADAADPVPNTDVWQWKDMAVHPAGILVRMLEEAQERGCYPDLTYDFTRTEDSNGDPWTITIAEVFQLQVGMNMLEVVAKLQALGLVLVMDHDLTLHAYESVDNAYVGRDLSASVTLTKGADITDSAEREQVSASARSTTLTKGARSDNGEIAWVPFDSPSALSELGRRKEGFLDAGDATHFDTLQLMGANEIYRKLRLKAGPTGISVTDPNADGKRALIDYTVGDQITVDIPGVFNEVAKPITSIQIREREAVRDADDEDTGYSDYDVVVGFDEDPARLDLPPDIAAGPAGAPDSGCCPDEPFVPEIGDVCAVSTASGTRNAPGTVATDADAIIYYCSPGHPYPDTKTPGFSGGWAFFGSAGGSDFGSSPFWASGAQQLRLIVSGDGVIAFTMDAQSGPQIFDWVLVHGPEGAATTDDFGTGVSGTPVSVDVSSHGGAFCEHRIIVHLASQPITSAGFGFDTMTWTLGSGGITNAPGNGQAVVESTAGDAVADTFTTNFPYYPNSLHVWVNGILWPVTETDPTTGEFTFATPPPNDAVIVIHYQATGEAGTGAGNDPTPDASTPTGSAITVEESGDTPVSPVDHIVFAASGSSTVDVNDDGAGQVTVTVGTSVSGDFPWVNVEDYGAVHDGTSDDTAAIQDAIDAVMAAGGGTLFFPNGIYQLDGALQDTSGANAQLVIPQHDYDGDDVPLAIRFLGEGPNVPLSDAPSGTGQPATTGAILRSSWNGTISGNPAIISAGLQDAVYPSGDWNWIAASFEHIEIRAHADPKLTALNFSAAWGLRWDNLTVSVNAASEDKVLPTHSNAVGVDMPWSLNAQPDDGGRNLTVDGYYTGLRPSEQTNADYVSFGHCTRAIDFRGTSNLRHSTTFGRILVYWCQRSLVFSGSRWVWISTLNVEHDLAPFATVYDIDDASALGRGFIGWHTTEWLSGVSDNLLVNNGAGLSLYGFYARRWYLQDVIEMVNAHATPGAPASGYGRMYVASEMPKWKDSANNVYDMVGAPIGADYLVGTAQGGLSGEIVVGTTPGGELGGTWPSPTVDTTHSGSSHAATQAAAEATAAAALAAHIASSPSSSGDHEHMIDVFNGDGSTTAFEITDEPLDPEAVFAFVAGAWTAVAVSGPMNTTVTFGAAPGSGTGNVVIQYPAVAA